VLCFKFSTLTIPSARLGSPHRRDGRPRRRFVRLALSLRHRPTRTRPTLSPPAAIDRSTDRGRFQSGDSETYCTVCPYGRHTSHTRRTKRRSVCPRDSLGGSTDGVGCPPHLVLTTVRAPERGVTRARGTTRERTNERTSDKFQVSFLHGVR